MASVKKTKYDILRAPRITEKTASLNSLTNCVVFDVHTKANKTEIKEAVESIFDVKVKGVRTVNTRGKVKRVGQKVGRRNDWKKAYVSLEQGSSVDVVEGL